MTEKVLAVDPGVSGTGYALISNVYPYLIQCGTLRPSSEKDWMTRAVGLNEELFHVVRPMKNVLTRLVIEYPQYMGNVGGHMVAQRGDLVKLSVLCGMMIHTLMTAVPELGVKIVTPNEWKGQLPKPVCQERIEKICGRSFVGHSDHAVDAIGIGLWAVGKF